MSLSEERTFEGLIYEWSQEISKDEPNKRIGGIILADIRKLKNKLNKFEDNKMENILFKWSENEDRLKRENLELKKELDILRKMPTPEDFEEEFRKQEKSEWVCMIRELVCNG